MFIQGVFFNTYKYAYGFKALTHNLCNSPKSDTFRTTYGFFQIVLCYGVPDTWEANVMPMLVAAMCPTHTQDSFFGMSLSHKKLERISLPNRQTVKVLRIQYSCLSAYMKYLTVYATYPGSFHFALRHSVLLVLYL